MSAFNSLAVVILFITACAIPDHGCVLCKKTVLFPSAPDVLLDAVLRRVLMQATSPLEALKKKKT
jgi:hypothetical protein